MKCSPILAVSLLSFHAVPALSQLVLPNLFTKATAVRQQQQQAIMNEPKTVLPPTDNNNQASDPDGEPMISDVIGKERIINIFAGFTRDIETISSRLDDNEQNTTVLAPLNSELMKLSHKPWENPRDYGAMGSAAYEGQDGEDRAHRNLRRFVEAHVVPVSPWKEGDKVETLGGSKVWWETSHGKQLIQPGNVEVSTIASRVANGELWIIKGVVNDV